MLLIQEPFTYTIILYITGALYFFLYSKNHLVTKTAQKEFAMLERAECDLAHELG
jgi:ethanolamine permease